MLYSCLWTKRSTEYSYTTITISYLDSFFNTGILLVLLAVLHGAANVEGVLFLVRVVFFLLFVLFCLFSSVLQERANHTFWQELRQSESNPLKGNICQNSDESKMRLLWLHSCRCRCQRGWWKFSSTPVLKLLWASLLRPRYHSFLVVFSFIAGDSQWRWLLLLAFSTNLFSFFYFLFFFSLSLSLSLSLNRFRRVFLYHLPYLLLCKYNTHAHTQIHTSCLATELTLCNKRSLKVVFLKFAPRSNFQTRRIIILLLIYLN